MTNRIYIGGSDGSPSGGRVTYIEPDGPCPTSCGGWESFFKGFSSPVEAVATGPDGQVVIADQSPVVIVFGPNGDELRQLWTWARVSGLAVDELGNIVATTKDARIGEVVRLGL